MFHKDPVWGLSTPSLFVSPPPSPPFSLPLLLLTLPLSITAPQTGSGPLRPARPGPLGPGPGPTRRSVPGWNRPTGTNHLPLPAARARSRPSFPGLASALRPGLAAMGAARCWERGKPGVGGTHHDTPSPAAPFPAPMVPALPGARQGAGPDRGRGGCGGGCSGSAAVGTGRARKGLLAGRPGPGKTVGPAGRETTGLPVLPRSRQRAPSLAPRRTGAARPLKKKKK